MTEHYVHIIVAESAPSEARKEIKELQFQTSCEISLILRIPFMLHKGLKYVPTILAWAFEKGGSYGDEHPKELSKKRRRIMLEIYKELESKVDVKIDRTPMTGFRAFWPCEVLDIKEVQEEAELLVKSNEILLKMSDKRDYWMLFRHTVIHKMHPWKNCHSKRE
ncbi:MAG: hypothetical protein JTT13_04655 [Candidatus Brockarchaeota archaeon]|nr:hypothetical protein [Candidatus Brockarchaeota archaeon]